MLFRKDGDHVIAIAQPSHAWLSGQLVRAWGNRNFAVPAPFEEVCLGAEQHDIGWLGWETAPSFDPVSGLPHAFGDVTTETHIALWTQGVEHALGFGRYPALLVSLHAKTVYGRFFDPSRAAPHDARIVEAFLSAQEDFRSELVGALAADPETADQADPESIEHNRLLVGAADWLSLALCWGVDDEVRVPYVPTFGTDEIVLSLWPLGPGTVGIDPWPFRTDALAVICEGRRIPKAFPDEASMRLGLAKAPRVRIAISLRPE